MFYFFKNILKYEKFQKKNFYQFLRIFLLSKRILIASIKKAFIYSNSKLFDVSNLMILRESFELMWTSIIWSLTHSKQKII